MRLALSALTVAAAVAFSGQASAANQAPPASGLLIKDLAGTPMLPGYTQYTSAFVATSAFSTVTFVFRHDPGFFGFDDASVTDSTHPGSNLLSNPGFELGAPTAPGGGAPSWTYFQQAGVTYLGNEASSGTNGTASHSGSFYWSDGATEGYDGIDQTFATQIGDTYGVSFFLAQVNSNGVPTPGNLYQALSTNGASGTQGNGIDVLVYAGNGLPPTTTPEPMSLAILGVALAGLGVAARKRR